MTLQDLANRARGEYAEMPGLSLTLPQAARLWHLDLATCNALLQMLVHENILTRTPSGTFVALPYKARPLKTARHETAGRSAPVLNGRASV